MTLTAAAVWDAAARSSVTVQPRPTWYRWPVSGHRPYAHLCLPLQRPIRHRKYCSYDRALQLAWAAVDPVDADGTPST